MIIAGLIHVMVATLVAYLLAFIWGTLTPTIAVVSLLVGLVAGLWQHRSVNASLPEFRFGSFSLGVNGWIERILFVLLIYLGWRHFAFMLYPSDRMYRTLSLTNFGDLPLHINYIRQMALGSSFPPVNPEFSAEPLRYPFGVDLYNALWEALGAPITSHLFVFGMAATVASLVALRAFAGWWGVGAFFFNSGLIGWDMLRKLQVLEPNPNLAWKNLFLSVFVTQRGVLFALPAGLLLLHFVRRVFMKEILPTRLQMFWMGLFWGSMALFHLHTFFVISLIIVGLAVIYYEEKLTLKVLTRLLIWAVPIGTIFTLYSTGFLQKAGVAHWRWGWMSGSEGFLKFMSVNFGPYLILAAALPFVIFTTRHAPISREGRRLVVEWGFYIGLFALFLNLMLAPWEWDNVKVLIRPYLGLMAVARQAFGPLDRKRLSALLMPALAIVLFCGGAVQVFNASQTTRSAVGIFIIEELANAEGALRSVGRDAVIAAAPTHDHPLVWLGRIRPLGYDGHLWSHGIDYHAPLQKFDALMKGEPGWRETAKALGITHIFWGPFERRKYGEIEPEWKKLLVNASTVAGYEVYEVQQETSSK